MAAPADTLYVYDTHHLEDIDGRKGHIFSLNEDHGKGAPYLSLKIYNAGIQHGWPFFEATESTINGVVEIDLKKAKAVSEVDIYFRGYVVASSLDKRTFLEIRESLWDKSKGDAHSAHQSDQVEEHTHSHQSLFHAFKEAVNGVQLEGTYSFPFSFKIPSSLTFTEKEAHDLGIGVKAGVAYPLPVTFDNNQGGSAIVYNMEAKVKSGSLLSPDYVIHTPVGYGHNPNQEQKTPSDEINDDVTWKAFPEVDIVGEFAHQDITVKHKLSIPDHPAYKRGSAIPVRLLVSSADLQILKLFSDHGAPVVELHHEVRTPIGIDSAGSGTLSSGNDSAIPVAKAAWKAVKTQNDSQELEGVIHIPQNVPPSFSFGDFHLEYNIQIYPSRVAGFKPRSDKWVFRSAESIIVV